MAYRDVDDWHRRTAPRRYPPSPLPVAEHDWRAAGETTFDSLPYRRPKDLIQAPDEIISSPGRSRISRNSSGASASVVETMPIPSRGQVPETYRRGRYPAPGYDFDLYADEDEVVPTLGRKTSPRRGRSPRGAHHPMPRRVYEKSSTSSPSRSETDTDEDSATSISTEDEKRSRKLERARREKEKERQERRGKRTRRAVVEERRPPPEEKKKPKRRRKIREIVYVEEDDESTVHTPRRSVDARSSSPLRHHSRLSRSASERQYSRPRSHSPVRRSSQHRPSTNGFISKPAVSSQRLAYGMLTARGDSDLGPSRPSRTHHSDIVQADSRLVHHSNIMSGAASYVTSHSTTSSNKRAAPFLGHLRTGSARSHSPEKPVKMDSCVICMDDLRASKHPKLKCGHRMCDSCLKWSFQLSIKNSNSVPPKCCTSDYIPLEYVDRLLSSDFKKKWNIKHLEYSTRNRIYCPSRRCGEWIRPGDIRRKGGRKCGSCRACGLDVCCSCKGKWHSSRDCPDDEDTTRFLKQARDAGWQRCYKCSHIVQLQEGCNHMTCRCGAQFCMICGIKWKDCDCPWFYHETAETDRLHGTSAPALIQRLERLDPTATSRSMRLAIESGPPPPSHLQEEYDDRLVRRFQENRDEDQRRVSSYGGENVLDRGYGEMVVGGTKVRSFMNSEYRGDAEDVFVSRPLVPPAPTPPAAFERPAPTDYMSGVKRARGLPQDSLGQRLAERFSEYRASPAGPSRTGMMATASPPPITAAMGMGPPPPIPLLRRHTMDGEMYDSAGTTRPSERMIPGRVVHDYEREAAVHAPRSRRRPYTEPKSSTLAGLTGPGRGMNRVFEWRTHVHPGMPEDARA